MKGQHVAQKTPVVVALGEVLWDVFPDARLLGGAPLNFAVHAKNLGADAHIVSRIGTDDLGDKIAQAVQRFGLSMDTVQRDPARPTGRVNVTLDLQGRPTFEIVRDVAWDAIEETPEAQALVARAEAVCFGTLAQRSARSRTSIQNLLARAKSARLKVCDINFRQRFYTLPIVTASLKIANVLKLNEDELPLLLKLLKIGDGKSATRADVLALMKGFQLDVACVTLGERGAVLHTLERELRSPGYRVQVVDTVGSGDAFTAGLVVKLLGGAPHTEALDFANLVGAYVATQPGATPALDAKVLSAFADGRQRTG